MAPIRITSYNVCYTKLLRDGEPDNPARANELAATLKALLSSQRKGYPNLAYLVIAGDDGIVPFYRAYHRAGGRGTDSYNFV